MTSLKTRILLVEDNPADARIVREFLAEAGASEFDLIHIERLSEAMNRIGKEPLDVVLLDLSLPDAQGLDTVANALQQASDVPIVVLTGTNDESLAFQAVQAGAQDYLVKWPEDGNLLVRAIRYAIERHRLTAELDRRVKELQAARAVLHQKIKESQAARAILLHIINENADGIVVIGDNGSVRFVNPAAEYIFGRKSSEFMGRPFDYPVAESDWAEIDITRKDGKRITAEMRIVETEWEGETTHLASIRDITGRYVAVGQLAKRIADDFDILLKSIKYYSDILQQRPDISKPVKEHLKVVRSQGKKARQLVRQLMEYSGQTSITRQPTSLLSLVQETIESLEQDLPKNIDIVLNCESQDPGSFIVDADPTKIQKVLTNLAFNANNAMPNGGELRISLSLCHFNPGEESPLPELPEGSWIALEISDTGMGISQNGLARIFEPFYGAREGGGEGIGLAQVYGIIKQQGGHINVESQEGKGTTFTVYLPAFFIPDEGFLEGIGEGSPASAAETQDS
ncbi:MAG: ATP-binding protein [Thermoplasmata archaeon]